MLRILKNLMDWLIYLKFMLILCDTTWLKKPHIQFDSGEYNIAYGVREIVCQGRAVKAQGAA